MFTLARRWLAIGESADAMRLVGALAWSPAATPTLARDSLSIAQHAVAHGLVAEARVVLERIVDEAPDSAEAAKARVLLTDPGR